MYKQAIDEIVFPSAYEASMSDEQVTPRHEHLTYQRSTVTKLATIMATSVQRKLSGMTVVLNGLLIGMGILSVTPRTVSYPNTRSTSELRTKAMQTVARNRTNLVGTIHTKNA
jgi:hypothetical protein